MDSDKLRHPRPAAGADLTRHQPDRSGAPGPDEQAHGHERWMGEALGLARAMLGRVWPNPAVGCVIVNDGRIVGRGQTQPGGRPHAERVALDDAGDLSRGSSLYVTLEPCCHWGRTPPCADAIVAAGIKKVFASLQDPDPRVNGGGFRKLRDAGIEVEIGLGAREARRITAGFFHRVATGEPMVAIGEIHDDLSFIPDGYDAVMRTQGGDRLWLLTRAAGVAVRARQVAYPGSPATDLLQALGRLGLTTVYVPAADPLAIEIAIAEAGPISARSH